MICVKAPLREKSNRKILVNYVSYSQNDSVAGLANSPSEERLVNIHERHTKRPVLIELQMKCDAISRWFLVLKTTHISTFQIKHKKRIYGTFKVNIVFVKE